MCSQHSIKLGVLITLLARPVTKKMTVKTKFYEVDLKPVCKKCYDRYPRDMRLRLKKYHEAEATRDQRAGSV